MNPMHDPDLPSPSRARFASTCWSIVLAAGKSGTAQSEKALSLLCESYWPPVYGFLRRHGYSVHNAEDLTQGFFARFLEKNYLKGRSPDKRSGQQESS